MRNVVVAALAVAGLAACAPQAPAPLEGDALVARGEYLVVSVAGCNDCHTPMTPEGPDMTRSLQGATLIFAPTIEMPWAPVAPPLAGIPGHFTHDQFASFLQNGVRPNGSRTLPPMPPYRMNEDDARAVTAYIATLPRGDQPSGTTAPQ